MLVVVVVVVVGGGGGGGVCWLLCVGRGLLCGVVAVGGWSLLVLLSLLLPVVCLVGC